MVEAVTAAAEVPAVVLAAAAAVAGVRPAVGKRFYVVLFFGKDSVTKYDFGGSSILHFVFFTDL